MTISLDLFQTLTLSVLALLAGDWTKKKVAFLSKFCVPSPVIGGLVFAVISLIGHVTGWFICNLDDTLKMVCMVFFFTSVGFQANYKTIKRGGKPLLLLLMLVIVTVILQNALSVGIAYGLNLPPITGMTAGSIPMIGGHGTAGAFGPLLENMGVSGASTLTTAAATFGLVAGSLIGGPIGRRLIESNHLLQHAPSHSSFEQEEDSPLQESSATAATYQMILAIGLGTVVSYLLSLTGMTFPIYIGAMLVAAAMRNIDEYRGKHRIALKPLNSLGNICLSLFLGIAMVTLRLWELADLALPLTLMLTAQLVFMAFYVYFIVFPTMGRDYDAAVLTSGFCGFGMGATPNAMANMQAICERYQPSIKAYLLIPIVGSMFSDFINSVIITCFINLL